MIKPVTASSYTLQQSDDVRRTLFVEGDNADALSNQRSVEDNAFLLYETTSPSNASHTVRVRLASGNWISLNQFEYRVP